MTGTAGKGSDGARLTARGQPSGKRDGDDEDVEFKR